MIRIVLVFIMLWSSTTPAHAYLDSISESLDDSRKEIGAIFEKKGDGRKSLRETTSEAWHWLWQ